MSDYTHVVSGLLRRREELKTEAATIDERKAVILNDLAALERLLESFGHSIPSIAQARPARIILFYRNELQNFLKEELQRATGPVTSRDLAMILCQLEGKHAGDRRLVADVMKRISRALDQMRQKGAVVSDGKRKNGRWQLNV